MRTAEQYLSDARSILLKDGSADGATLTFTCSTPAEAKQHLAQIRQTQKELRQIKKEVAQCVKEIRASYAAARGATQAGLLPTLLGPGRAGRDRAIKKRQLTQQQNNQIAPYNLVSQAIDKILINLDATKLKLDGWVATNK